jgi:hypothetical protein
MTAYSKRQEHQFKLGAWVAWNTAALSRMKKMPAFEKFADIHKKTEPQSWERQLKIIKGINKSLGGKDLTNG